MNSRERVWLALTCRRPDRIPKALAFFNQSVPGIAPEVPEDYFGLDVRFTEFDAPPEQDDLLHYLRQLPVDVHVGNLKQLKTYHEWNYHPELVSSGPLSRAQTVADISQFVFPNLREPQRYAGLDAQVAAWHRAGYAVAGSPPHLGGELFETAWRLRGFSNFMADMVMRKPLAHYLLDQLTALLIHTTLILARADVDILLLDDDVAMPTGLLMGLTTWREFFRPRLADTIRLARQASPELLVFYHSDGDFTALLPDLVEIGVNVINPVQPDCMDAVRIKQEFGDGLAMWGTVGSAWLWDHGTPDQIRAEVKRRIDTLGPEGLLLSPAYDVDFAPLENLMAFSEAVDKYGRM